MARINKARYWQAVLYPENMVEDWEDRLPDIIQVPFAYCIHSKDTDGQSEHRKDHVHLIAAFSNTTTYKHAMSVFKLLGEKALNKCEACVNIRHCYDYLIHDTEASRKQGKHLYSPDERITGNNFDIGCYEQIDQQAKDEMLREMLDFIVANGISDITTFYILFEPLADARYFDVFRSNGGLIERVCKGNFHRNSAFRVDERGENSTQLHADCCPDCGSVEIGKRGKTAGGTQRFVCKNCGKSFVL